jgi:hypothetical protein
MIALAQGGDPTAIEGLLIKCRPDLGRYARRHCASDDVDDAVQDALWIIRQRVGGCCQTNRNWSPVGRSRAGESEL